MIPGKRYSIEINCGFNLHNVLAVISKYYIYLWHSEQNNNKNSNSINCKCATKQKLKLILLFTVWMTVNNVIFSQTVVAMLV
jgi:hypothetical protein